MGFAFGETVIRERRPRVPNPYNPDEMVAGDWTDELDKLEIEDASIDSRSSIAPASPTRSQVLTTQTLYVDSQDDVDVKVGDRIRVSDDEVYYVNVRPVRGKNPFTGWRPPVEIQLDMTEG